jgi:DNA polymerase-3 subunit epsilon
VELVIFDIETTGLSPRYHDIIQIAAVRMRHGEVIAAERFDTFVCPRKGIPDSIAELTGVTHRDISNAPGPIPSLIAFSQFVGDATLVAHNGWRFDLKFIRESCHRHQLPMREVPFFDSMMLSRRLWANAESHSLDAVTARVGASGSGLRRHDARGDVMILAEAVRRMWLQLGTPSDQCPMPTGAGYLPQ